MDTPGLLVAFAAGALSFLSPCVLPLVPGYLSLMSGLSYDDVHAPKAQDRSRILFNAVLFVIGFTMVFVAYGAVASSIGSLILQNRDWLQQVAGVIIIAMGLVVMGILRLPQLQREKRFHVSPAALGPFAAPVMGMAFAFGWTPCIGPILSGVLALASSTDTLSQGVLLLVLYSLGLGIPFLLMGVAFDRFRGGWQWFKRHGRAIDLVSGALLVGFGLILFMGWLGWLSGWVLRVWNGLGFSSVLG